jgi:putative transposase
VTWAIGEKSYSQRRACALVGLHPKTYRHRSKRASDDGLRKRLRELASQRRRFGYRRLGLLLGREGIRLSHKKLYRLYREERLTVRRRGGRKRALGTRAPMAIPQDRNLRWSLDFVADTLMSGRRFRILTLVDDFTRECLGLVVDTSLTGLRVARELDRIAEQRSYPCMIVSDNGAELTSNAILAWQQDRGVEWHCIAPGKPMQMASSRASMAVCATSASGLYLFAKRLERGRFLWPSTADGTVTISTAQLGYLLEGIDWRMPQKTWRPAARRLFRSPQRGPCFCSASRDSVTQVFGAARDQSRSSPNRDARICKTKAASRGGL